MVKKGLLIGALLLSLLMVGCGIPQEDYDAVVSERDAAVNDKESAEAQVDSLKTELTNAQSQILLLKSELTTTKLLVDLLRNKEGIGTTVPITPSVGFTTYSKYGFRFDYPIGSSPIESGMLANDANENSGMVQVYLPSGEGILQVAWLGIVPSMYDIIGSSSQILEDSFDALVMEGIDTTNKGRLVTATKSGHELIYQYYNTKILGMNTSGVLGIFYCDVSERVYQLLTMYYSTDTEQEAIQRFQLYLDSFVGH
ncbi:hypothetical protein ACFLXX_00640 [Chloroflexota bacterium]